MTSSELLTPKGSILFLSAFITTFIPTASVVNSTTMTSVNTTFPSQTDHNLTIIGLFPWSGGWTGGESMLAASSLAIEGVNNRTDILPGYRLRLEPWDTQCDPGIAIKGMFEKLYSPPTKMMMLSGCSIVSEATARASHLWNIIQMSYVSVSPALSEKALYPKFARVSAPDSVTNPALVDFFRHFGWTRIATIHQTYEIFSAITEDLIARLKAENFTITRSEIFQEDPTRQIHNLKEHDCRIIVGGFYTDKARKAFCEVYKLGMYGLRYVWLLPGWYDPDWWLVEDPNIDCTPEQLAEAVEGYFDAGIITLNPNPDRSVSGWLPSEFLAAYKERVGGKTLSGQTYAPQAFDTIWALALALNDTLPKLRTMGKGFEDFTYEDKNMSDMIFSSLLNLSFMGVRGHISFDKNGDLMGHVRLDRVQGGVKKMVGLHNPANLKQGTDAWDWMEDNPVVWEGGTPPRDARVTRTVYVTLSVPLYATMCVLSALGMLLAAGFLTFNIVLKNVKIVKMSSPRLNNVILLGCVLAYASILVQDAGGQHGKIGCEIMSDGQLFAMVGALVCVNAIVLVTWWVVDPRTLKITSVVNVMEEDEAGEVTLELSDRFCVSEYQLYFLGTLYGIHALVLIFGIFLAWETRKVHYPELNDSKYIGMCIYNVALLCIPGVLVAVALDTGVNLSYALESTLVLLGTTVTQCIIFVPKVLSYRQNRVDPAKDTRAQTTSNVPSAPRVS